MCFERATDWLTLAAADGQEKAHRTQAAECNKRAGLGNGHNLPADQGQVAVEPIPRIGNGGRPRLAWGYQLEF
jgi:hypothetical protein